MCAIKLFFQIGYKLVYSYIITVQFTIDQSKKKRGGIIAIKQ